MIITSFKYWVPIISLLLTSLNATAQSTQQSHLEANLPNTFEEFKIILNRDLQKHFSEKLKTEVDVVASLLRTAPTQSGVSYPKFYAWVEILKSNRIFRAGAVRVVAKDKVRVEVTHFYSEDDIKKQPKSIEQVFPLALCDEIRARARTQ